MDDAALIATAAAAPVGVGTVLWFFIRAWISRVEGDIEENKKSIDAKTSYLKDQILESKAEILSSLKETNNSIIAIRIELAEAGVKKTAEKVDKLAERMVVQEGRISAAWKTLESKGIADKRLSDN